MSGLYTSLQVSPRKKRCPPELDDGNTLTPKKLRLVPPTPPPSSSKATKHSLPASLTRLYNIQTTLQHALSHALATCAISPTSDSGIVRNVLNHISLTTYTGLTSSFEADDLKRLCWLWEWDGKGLDEEKKISKADGDDEDNPFISTSTSSTTPTEWTRGAMGIVISPATHFSKRDRKRVPAYGIGIEVEMDIDKDMSAGMAAVARWTATGDKRRAEVLKKLERWAELHPDAHAPVVPLANIPELSAPKISALTRTLATASPSSASPIKFPVPPSSPSRSPAKRPAQQYAIPFPTMSRPVSPFKKSAVLFPKTPSRRNRNGDPDADDVPPQTPSSTSSSPAKDISTPSTPVHQRTNGTPAQTPSTARRDALYERIRQRSLSMSPTKTPRSLLPSSSKVSKDQMTKMAQDELRQRCLLGRLGGVAESIWMLFSTPAAGSSSTPSRKRRALPTADVVTAIVKSSPVPISTAEANESINMLIKRCPFFLKKLDISGGEWLEMPAPNSNSSTEVFSEGSPTKSPTKRKIDVPPSPGKLRSKEESAQELLNRSPRRVKRETGGLREVREIIRRELELQD